MEPSKTRLPWNLPWNWAVESTASHASNARACKNVAMNPQIIVSSCLTGPRARFNLAILRVAGRRIAPSGYEDAHLRCPRGVASFVGRRPGLYQPGATPQVSEHTRRQGLKARLINPPPYPPVIPRNWPPPRLARAVGAHDSVVTITWGVAPCWYQSGLWPSLKTAASAFCAAGAAWHTLRTAGEVLGSTMRWCNADAFGIKGRLACLIGFSGWPFRRPFHHAPIAAGGTACSWAKHNNHSHPWSES
jgi:hypothetical protein